MSDNRTIYRAVHLQVGENIYLVVLADPPNHCAKLGIAPTVVVGTARYVRGVNYRKQNPDIHIVSETTKGMLEGFLATVRDPGITQSLHSFMDDFAFHRESHLNVRAHPQPAVVILKSSLTGKEIASIELDKPAEPGEVRRVASGLAAKHDKIYVPLELDSMIAGLVAIASMDRTSSYIYAFVRGD